MEAGHHGMYGARVVKHVVLDFNQGIERVQTLIRQHLDNHVLETMFMSKHATHSHVVSHCNFKGVFLIQI
jgi:hypothetical protein